MDENNVTMRNDSRLNVVDGHFQHEVFGSDDGFHLLDYTWKEGTAWCQRCELGYWKLLKLKSTDLFSTNDHSLVSSLLSLKKGLDIGGEDLEEHVGGVGLRRGIEWRACLQVNYI